jgi:membrane protease YdiL (CAAX protease family)
MKRIFLFLRSVLPADPWQLVLLVGVVFLFISPRLAWYANLQLLFSENSGGFGLNSANDIPLLHSIVAFTYAITFAGLAAYFICFYPGPKPVRGFLWFVFLPCSAALLLILSTLFRISRPASSVVFQPRSTLVIFLDWFYSNISHFPLGIYSCALSMALIAAFVARLAFARSSLPLALAAPPPAAIETPDSSEKTFRLIFVLIAPLFVAQVLVGLPLTVSLIFLSQVPPWFSVLTRISASLIDAGVLVALALWILGPRARSDARNSLHFPEFHQIFLALLLPLGICVLLSVPSYAIDRTNWAIYASTRELPPLFSSYFDFNGLHDPWLLLLAVGAFAEELVFRGLLLPRLSLRFGIHRGIFLTGITWAAYHFRFDSYQDLSGGGVLLHLAHRILICLAMNYVLAWMTLRWNSFIPAGIAHTFSNILIIAGLNRAISWSDDLRIVGWALAAFLLYRYRSVTTGESADPTFPTPQFDVESTG